ncbi:hypothetical protein BDEG_24033 [Batrachochytrium dendrobatidis JEL423]|uniref:PH domain-containing protein n=1 Tax=Batrachochytrium dendrobatidis (strain JEL423) TaxID=403673 RepID=A0A177WJH4_BATDL|nr:hypothetical protein BDEG_24033 [Batrachochytrium dendrobatidis JEL423]
MNNLFQPTALDSCTSPSSQTLALLKSASLTHAQYDPADPLGKLMAYATLTPIALLVAYTTQCLFSRDLASGFMLLGQLVNEGVNYILKNSIRQDRPTVYSSIYTLRKLRLEYHSLEQVCVGSAVGALMGVVWYVLVQQVLFPLAEYFQVVDGWIGQMFLLRDTRSCGPQMQGHCSPPLQQSIADTATQPSHIEVVHYPFSDESDIDDQQPSQRQSPSPTRLSKHEKQQKPAGCFGSSATETLAKEHIIMSGYLLKKGEQRRSWKRRWFVLRPGMLSYYQSDKEYEILNIIPLADITTIAQVELRKRLFVFGMVTRKRTYYVCASSAVDRDTWMTAIKAAHRSARSSTTTPDLALSGVSGSHPSTSTTPHQVMFSLPAQRPSTQVHRENTPGIIRTNRTTLDEPSQRSPVITRSDTPSILESVATIESVLTIGSNPSSVLVGANTNPAQILTGIPTADEPMLQHLDAPLIPESTETEQRSDLENTVNPNTHEPSRHNSNLSTYAQHASLPAPFSIQPSWSESSSDYLYQSIITSEPSNTSSVHLDIDSTRVSTHSSIANQNNILSMSAPSQLSAGLRAAMLGESVSEQIPTPSNHLKSTSGIGEYAAAASSTSFPSRTQSVLRPGNIRSISDLNLSHSDDPARSHQPFSDYEDDEEENNGSRSKDALEHLTMRQRELYRPALVAMANDQVVRQGYLLKLGGGLPRQWKQRWFVLRNGHLTCYKNSSEYEVLRIISLASILDVLAVDPPRGAHRHIHCFKIVLAKRSMLLCADTNQVAADWVESFQQTLRR